MRKQVITPNAPPDSDARENWLDVNTRAQVELTFEGTAYPIEAALAPSGSAWRATGTGEQSIRLLFDAPLSLRHIPL